MIAEHDPVNRPLFNLAASAGGRSTRQRQTMSEAISQFLDMNRGENIIDMAHYGGFFEGELLKWCTADSGRRDHCVSQHTESEALEGVDGVPPQPGWKRAAGTPDYATQEEAETALKLLFATNLFLKRRLRRSSFFV